MSNALAIPAVTATIASIVLAGVDRLGINPRPVVAPGPLDDEGDNARVGVHLYRVTRNPALAAADLPTRSSAGDLRQRPRVALDLHYLLTFRGNTPWETERLLAQTAVTLHAVPVLTAALLQAAGDDHPEIADNDLAAADEPVRLCPDLLTIDELTRIWALFPPSSFTVTLALTAGPVVIDAATAAGAMLPVRQVASGARATRRPRLDGVGGPDGVGAPVRAADPMPEVDAYGAGFAVPAGDSIEVLVDGAPVAGVTVVDDGHLRLPSAGLAPGTHAIRVRRVEPPIRPDLSTTAVSVDSAPVSLVVVPTLAGVSASTHAGTAAGERTGTVTVDVVPALGPPQRVRLLLDSTAATPPVAYALSPAWADADPPATTVTFAVTDARAGAYRVTLEVDGVRSIPPVDGAGHYVLPTVTL
jgi:hypothetical protein